MWKKVRAWNESRHLVHADVFIPKARVFFDELRHHLVALGQIKIDHFDPVLAHEFRPAGALAALPDEPALNAELHRRTGAEIARHQRGIERATAIRTDAPGIAQAI